MNTLDLVMYVVGIAINTALFFYILCEGFYWKPSRAIFIAPFGTIVIPIFMLISFFLVIGHGLTFLGNKGVNLVEKAFKV